MFFKIFPYIVKKHLHFIATCAIIYQAFLAADDVCGG